MIDDRPSAYSRYTEFKEHIWDAGSSPLPNGYKLLASKCSYSKWLLVCEVHSLILLVGQCMEFIPYFVYVVCFLQ